MQLPVATLWLGQELCHLQSPAALETDFTEGCPATAAGYHFVAKASRSPRIHGGTGTGKKLLPWKLCWQQ